jgi:hypothetical protein
MDPLTPKKSAPYKRCPPPAKSSGGLGVFGVVLIVVISILALILLPRSCG